MKTISDSETKTIFKEGHLLCVICLRRHFSMTMNDY